MNCPAIDPKGSLFTAGLIKSVKCPFPCTVSCPHILMNSRKITIVYGYRWLWCRVKPGVYTNNFIIRARWWLHGENVRLECDVLHLFSSVDLQNQTVHSKLHERTRPFIFMSTFNDIFQTVSHKWLPSHHVPYAYIAMHSI